MSLRSERYEECLFLIVRTHSFTIPYPLTKPWSLVSHYIFLEKANGWNIGFSWFWQIPMFYSLSEIKKLWWILRISSKMGWLDFSIKTKVYINIVFDNRRYKKPNRFIASETSHWLRISTILLSERLNWGFQIIARIFGLFVCLLVYLAQVFCTTSYDKHKSFLWVPCLNLFHASSTPHLRYFRMWYFPYSIIHEIKRLWWPFIVLDPGRNSICPILRFTNDRKSRTV